jgi:hypothetical protein
VNKGQAIAEVKRIFGRYHGVTQRDDRWLSTLAGGKVYELYCLSKVLERLRQTYGFRLQFRGTNIQFQASPGYIDHSRPHFIIQGSSGHHLELFTDIEFTTLGKSRTQSNDLSSYHEVDLVVVPAGINGRPSHQMIALAVECKSHAIFTKSIVKEVLGVRREMTFLQSSTRSILAQLSPLHPSITVPADPASEYWVAFSDARGLQYAHSPSAFGITFQHWQP